MPPCTCLICRPHGGGGYANPYGGGGGDPILILAGQIASLAAAIQALAEAMKKDG